MGQPTTEQALMWPKLTSLRAKLAQKAKQEPKFRFYTLYGLLYRVDILEIAWQQVWKNGGAAGVDGITIDAIRQANGGVDRLLREIARELQERTYTPKPVRRVYIPRPDGKLRPLGIPTVKDRIVQAAVALILEPIFDSDFLDCSYGFRPGRSAHQAIDKIQEYVQKGYQEVYDADLQKCFDTIPHDNLMKCLEKRIADRGVLKLIKSWLRSPIVEKTEDGKTRIHSADQGTPQGGVISPLLANIYLHWFDKMISRTSAYAQGAIRLVRYADDFIVMARSMTQEIQQHIEDTIEKWMKLKINREKTKLVDLKRDGGLISFLGFSFRYDRSRYHRSRKYLNIFPKQQAMVRAREKIRALTDKAQNWKPVSVVIQELNQFLTGWRQYFDKGYPSKAFSTLNHFVGFRLYRHLLRRSQRRKYNTGEKTWYQAFTKMGLVRLRRRCKATA